MQNLVGARAVQKVGEFELCFDDRLVELKKSINVYCVERIEGDLLFLKAEGKPVCGWAGIDQVVPIEQALEFFDIQARARPLDPFPRMMIAKVRRDRKEYDKAIADFNEAINLDPSSAYTFGNRGFAWFAKNEYDKAIADLGEAIKLDPTEAKAFATRGNVWFAMNDCDCASGSCGVAALSANDQSMSRSARSAARNGNDASWSESAPSPARDKPISRSLSIWSRKASHLAREDGSRRRSSSARSEPYPLPSWHAL
jgi:tetratricopeptide (TPR) repeat protein